MCCWVKWSLSTNPCVVKATSIEECHPCKKVKDHTLTYIPEKQIDVSVFLAFFAYLSDAPLLADFEDYIKDIRAQIGTEPLSEYINGENRTVNDSRCTDFIAHLFASFQRRFQALLKMFSTTTSDSCLVLLQQPWSMETWKCLSYYEVFRIMLCSGHVRCCHAVHLSWFCYCALPRFNRKSHPSYCEQMLYCDHVSKPVYHRLQSVHYSSLAHQARNTVFSCRQHDTLWIART